MNRDGGFAEFLVYPTRTLHRVSKNIPFDQAVLIEPLTVAVNAIKLTMGQEFIEVINDDYKLNRFVKICKSFVEYYSLRSLLMEEFDYVAIFGDGPIGQLLLQVITAIYSKINQKVKIIVLGATPSR